MCLTKIENYAKENNVPIMQKDGIEYLCEFIKNSNIKYKSEQVKSVNCLEVSKIQARFILHVETKNENVEKIDNIILDYNNLEIH